MSRKFIEVTMMEDEELKLVSTDNILSVGTNSDNETYIEMSDGSGIADHYVKETYSEIKEKLLCS